VKLRSAVTEMVYDCGMGKGGFDRLSVGFRTRLKIKAFLYDLNERDFISHIEYSS
jgi:hypothetical protein